MLLCRDDFRNAVFGRDDHKCVICGAAGADAHHIIERRLWDDGGYYLENGATLCPACHIKAEQTLLSCEEIREAAGIATLVLPDHLYPDDPYDKWGNPILPDGRRMRGELFYDESVQKILAPVLHLFTKYCKYPRTYHLPFSPGFTKDDRVLADTSHFEGKEVVVTAKMDGENTNMYSDHIHARSIDSRHHPSRNWVKNLHGKIAWEIPEGWRICGENLYAKHTIKYENLEDYFLVFSIWDARNYCLSWEETVQYAGMLGLKTVPVLYEGLWDTKTIEAMYPGTLFGDPCEGFVVRIAGEFPFSMFRKSVGKYVRKNHVQTHGHWMHTQLEKNELKA
jgi:hypothetical protein